MNERINTDLILRENLAIERTRLANDRTLLSFIRTSLYFAVAGISANSLLDIIYGWVMEAALIGISIFLLIVGAVKYRRVEVKIQESKKSIDKVAIPEIKV